jgi:nucleoid-associated protein YgaU
MSALPLEQPPSGDHRTTTPSRAAGRAPSRDRSRTVRRATPVRQLFPDRDARLPDGDLAFPGGGRIFSGEALPPRPGASRPTAAELSLATAADEAWLATVAHARFAPAAAPAAPVAPAAPAAGPHPVRLTLRGRVVLVVIAALAVAGLVVAGATVAQASSPAAAHAGDSRVLVQPGDTLWSIAHRTDPGADPQTVVAGILRANHLPTAMVNVGQRIWVPRG